MSNIPPTTLDVSRSIIRLARHGIAAIATDSPVDVDGASWTLDELRGSVASNLGHTIENVVKVRKVSRRDVSLMMAAHGADSQTISTHGLAIAAMIRADLSIGTWGATV